jgi:hypothetical protein
MKSRIQLLALVSQAQYHINNDRAPYRWYRQHDQALRELHQLTGAK